MRKIILRLQCGFVLLAMALALPLDPALAGKIPIPCTGEALVKVLDIPALQALPAPAGGERVTALGYKFIGCFGGEWVGYTGSSSSYVSLDGAKIELLLALAGQTKLPPVPSFMGTPSASWVVWMYLVLFGGLGVMKGAAFIGKRAVGGNSSALSGAAKPDPSALPPEFDAVQAAMDRRIAERRIETANTNEPAEERRESPRRGAMPSAQPSRPAQRLGSNPTAPRAFGKRAAAG